MLDFSSQPGFHTYINNRFLFWNSHIPSDLLKHYLLLIHCRKTPRGLVIQTFPPLEDTTLSPSFNNISQHELKKSQCKTGKVNLEGKGGKDSTY